MKENSLYDKKSLKTVVGKTADFAELVVVMGTDSGYTQAPVPVTNSDIEKQNIYP